MILKAFGCSFIHGTDLSDTGTLSANNFPPSLSTWTALVAKALDLPYNCVAKGGAGNLEILDSVLSSVAMSRQERNLYVIAWTWSHRYDYSNPQGSHFNGPDRSAWQTLHPPASASTNDLQDLYFRHLHSEYRDKLTSLIYINSVIEIMQSLQLPFFMTCMDQIILDDRWHVTPGITYLQEKIRPHIADFQGQNFVQWATSREYPISDTGHPLEAAHAAAAELMLPRIQSLVNTM